VNRINGKMLSEEKKESSAYLPSRALNISSIRRTLPQRRRGKEQELVESAAQVEEVS